MTRVNWNNLRETPIGHLVALFRALEYNQHVTEINIGEFELFKLQKNNLTKSKHTRQRYDRPGHMQNVEKQRNSRNIECRIEFHHLQHHGRSGARGMQITRPHRAAH